MYGSKRAPGMMWSRSSIERNVGLRVRGEGSDRRLPVVRVHLPGRRLAEDEDVPFAGRSADGPVAVQRRGDHLDVDPDGAAHVIHQGAVPVGSQAEERRVVGRVGHDRPVRVRQARRREPERRDHGDDGAVGQVLLVSQIDALEVGTRRLLGRERGVGVDQGVRDSIARRERTDLDRLVRRRRRRRGGTASPSSAGSARCRRRPRS